ncbi:DUF4013 domain-containing protein [Natronorubrum halophilum]|uniref:DUF4013 domain-containing protein n=1 Tax=Natronorubrum halophilum TaxID=1702106 RepID=UPI0010C1DA36|nr:DUF4013 domain-containing protein [Natronorubrum halophilum]
MIGDVLRYPVSDEIGRTALLRCGLGVVAIAVGLRYAVALAPLAVALVPAFVALLGAITLLGTTSFVLGSDERRPRPSARAVIRSGCEALALATALLVPSIALLAWSLLETPERIALGNGTGLFALVSSTALVFVFIACAYVYPVAVAASVSTGRLRAAAEADALRPALTDATYFLRWTVGFSLVVLATWFAVTTFRRTDAVGLITAAAAAYLLVAGTRAVGLGYARAAGGGSTSKPR